MQKEKVAGWSMVCLFANSLIGIELGILRSQLVGASFLCDRGPIPEGTLLMPTAKLRASTILVEFHKAETELTGKAVVLTDGKAGTVEHVWLDELHGLRISVRGHEGKWPVSTIKLAQVDLARTSSIIEAD
jgi:hypothetical protein